MVRHPTFWEQFGVPNPSDEGANPPNEQERRELRQLYNAPNTLSQERENELHIMIHRNATWRKFAESIEDEAIENFRTGADGESNN